MCRGLAPVGLQLVKTILPPLKVDCHRPLYVQLELLQILRMTVHTGSGNVALKVAKLIK